MKTEELNINRTRVWKFTSGQDLLGYLGIDTEIGGKSCGGLRYLPDVDADEIADLAQAMTLKYGFLGLPQGGAKAGITAPPAESAADRNQRLHEFGLALSPWLQQKKYFPGTDMGISIDDLNIILSAAGIRLKPWQLGCRFSGTYTAATVFQGIISVCREKGRPVQNCTFALEGFGAVGSSLAEMLHQSGGRITAISTSHGAIYNEKGLDIPALLEKVPGGENDLFKGIFSTRPFSGEELKELPVDILCPCARHACITAENADRIKAWAVVPGANNPVTPEAEKILLSRNIMSLPDFVTNSGGVLGGTMAFAGIKHHQILKFIEKNFNPVYMDLFRESAEQVQTMREYAEKLALERHQIIRNASQNPSLSGKIIDSGLKIYRAGLIPKFFMGRASSHYFNNLLVFSRLSSKRR